MSDTPHPESLRLIFMGTPDFASAALKAIKEYTSHNVVAVYSQPPRPKGRGQSLQLSSVHALAEEYEIPVYHPLNFKDENDIELFSSHQADIAIVAAYGLLLPKAILEAPRLGCINIHASLLPRWRGAAPIQRSIMAGDQKTGISLMQMDEGLDTGPVIEMQDIPIEKDTTTSSLHDALADLGGEMIVQCLDKIAMKGTISSDPQQDTQTCYAKMLKKEEGHIDWSQDASVIERQIRALNPWPGTYSFLPEKKRIKVLKVKHINAVEESVSPGSVVNNEGLVACGTGALQLISVQPENKNPLDVLSAINGGYLQIGDKLV